MVLNQAGTMFASQISQNQDLITQQIAKEFNPANAAQIFSKIDPTQSLTGIVGGAAQLFQSVFGQIGGGGVGGLIQGGLNYLRS